METLQTIYSIYWRWPKINGTAFLVLIVIAIAGFYFYGTQIVNTVNSLEAQAYQQYANTQTNSALTIKPKTGQQMCTLKVVFTPFLAANVVPPIYARIDNGATSINWSSCTPATLSLGMLVPLVNSTPLDLLPPLDVFGLFNPNSAGYKFQGTLNADDGTQTHPLVNPVPAVGLNNAISGPGQSFTLTYVFINIPRQHYVLGISSDSIGINQAGSGNIYNQNITP